MRYLYTLFYENDASECQKIYEQRINSDSSKRLSLFIKPMNQPKYYELFYIPTNNIIDKVAKIYKLSGEINLIFNLIVFY